MPSRPPPPLPSTPPSLTTEQPLVSRSTGKLPPPPHRHSHHLNPAVLLPPLTAATVSFSLFLLLIVLFRKIRRRRNSPSSSSASDTNLPVRFPYSTLRRATSSFSASSRIGQGGFGAVYSATVSLNNQKRDVAVKLMDSGSLQGEREFHNEILIANKLVDSDRVVKLLGFVSDRKRRHMCLVYELMKKGNLQECLLHKKCEELMNWNKRVEIAVEIARGLAYLHHQCDPPIIHGDIKPSNVLLDDNFSAKIGDFGLARLKVVNHSDLTLNLSENDEVGVKTLKEGDESESINIVGVGVEDNGSLADVESVTTSVGFGEGSTGVDQSPENLVRPVAVLASSPELVTPMASPLDAWEKGSVLEEGQFGRDGGGNGKEVIAHSGKAKRVKNYEGSDSGKVKDYVMEWIGADLKKERPNSGWIAASSSSSVTTGKWERKKNKKRLEWWMAMDDGKSSKKDKSRPVREWWKEEYCEELERKKKKKKKYQIQTAMSDGDQDNWWPRDDDSYRGKKKKSRSRKSSRSSIDWWLEGLSGELRKGRQTSFDSISWEVPKSGGISSTPSMRGTVCYVAPEYSGGGDLSEKCDVYSFGVLLLVLIAGRRPLQVTSTVSEYQRANLISWARRLARSGKLLDLVDKKIHSLNKDQAQLCITVALLCLQKSPGRRPSIKEVVGILTGNLDPPAVPIEFSPSPNSRFPSKSRMKVL